MDYISVSVNEAREKLPDLISQLIDNREPVVIGT
jgi:PHD/YefM family antitoxin component YafN of YafNO toxin-antitoxin module